MKIKSYIPFTAIGLITATLSPLLLAAEVYTWDSDISGSRDGSGTWNSANTNWINASEDNVPFVSVTSGQVTRTTTNVAVTAGATTLTLTDVTGLVVGQELSIGNFPTGTTITDITGNVITLSSSSTGTISANTNINFQLPRNTAIFGTGGTAGTVTVSGVQNAGSLILDATASGNYTFTGDALTLGSMSAGTNAIVVRQSATFNNQVNSNGTNTARIRFETAGQTLTFTGGGSILAPGNGEGIYGSNATIGESSRIDATSGTYTGTFGIVNIGKADGTGGLRFTGENTVSNINIWQIGNSGSGFMSVSDSAIINASGQISVGRNNNNTGRLLIESGAVFYANVADNNQTVTAIGRNNGTGILDITGGRFESIGNGITGDNGGVMGINSDGTTNTNASGTLNISGGTVVVKDIRLNGTNQHQQANSSAGKAIINLSGGSLYVGGSVMDNTFGANANDRFATVGGISNRGTGTSTYEINLSGGTLGANADWASDLNMTFVSGTTTIKTADEADAAHNISLSGALSGDGGFTKTGGGELTLSGISTYTGDTLVSAGTLLVSGTLGATDVTVGTNAVIGGNGTINGGNLLFTADSGLRFDALMTLTVNSGTVSFENFSFANLIGFDASSIADGTYDLIDGTETAFSFTNIDEWGEDNAFDLGGGRIAYFSGDQNVGLQLIVIPEPSSISLLGLGLAGMAFVRRRKVA